MSFSTPTITNPCKKYYGFKSDEKKFVYYDKDEKKDVELPLPADIIVLDQLSTITGYSEKYKSSGYSNEVRNIKKEELRVKTFRGDFSLDGLYDEIKDNLGNVGLKYCKSLYCLLINPSGANELINIKLSGAALTEWIEAKINVNRNVITIENEFTLGRKGKTEYNIPKFTASELSDQELIEEAKSTDGVLQEFLNERLKSVEK